MIDVPQRVKDSLREGSYHKNWRIIVLADESNDQIIIENDNLVKDSIRLDERMCSGDQLKFGLCEGSSFEFQYFGYPNIKGRRIQVFLDIEFETEEKERDWFTLPMGFFDVDQCPRQFDTGIMKVTSFNKLRSKYFDEKANNKLVEYASKGEPGQSTISLKMLLTELNDSYSIEPKYEQVNLVLPTLSETALEGGVTNVGNIYFYDPNGFSFKPYYLSTGTGDMELGHYYRVTLKIKKLVELLHTDIGGEQSIKVSDGNSTNHYNAGKIRHYLPLTYWTPSGTAFYGLNSSVTVFGTTYDIFDILDTKGDEDVIINNVYIDESTLWYERSITMKLAIAQQHGIGKSTAEEIVYEFYDNVSDYIVVERMIMSDVEKMRFTVDQVKSFQDVTLRQLQSAVFETNCQFGQLDRETDLFSGVELNNHRLYPSELLYPRDDLFPISQAERTNASMYQKLWTDEGSQKKFKDLIITYKTIGDDGNPVERTLQRQVNADGNVNYNMSNNWLFKNLLWSAESVGSYADAMVEKMKSVSWIPFEMWCAGLPYLETGDELEIKTKEGTARSYILTRQLTGIHDLMDTYTNGELDIF